MFSEEYKRSPQINLICLTAIIICAILWFAAPFLAVNVLTLGNQPSGLQFIMGNTTYPGNLVGLTSFGAAIASLIGIILIFLCTLIKKDNASHIIAILMEIPMLVAFIDLLIWAADDPGDTFSMIIKAVGIGFWGIFALFFIIILATRRKDGKKAT